MGKKVPEILRKRQSLLDPTQVNFFNVGKDMFSSRQMSADKSWYRPVQERLVADMAALMAYRLFRVDVYWFNRLLMETKSIPPPDFMRKYSKITKAEIKALSQIEKSPPAVRPFQKLPEWPLS
jgi:hypothetical protein